MSKGGTRKIDDYTVAFHLDTPNGHFPYAVSIDNYNAVILPAGYSGDYQAEFMGTGPFRLESYRPRVGASFVRTRTTGVPRPCRTGSNSSSTPSPRRGCRAPGRGVDILDAIPVVLSPALAKNPDVTLIKGAFRQPAPASHEMR